MGSPEKAIVDVEMGDMSDEQSKLNPEVKTEDGYKEKDENENRFTGLTKEELLAVADQPKWVRARWALFVIFWLVWIGMLVGAIVIVVNAPRCKPLPDLKFYEDTIMYEADMEEFAGNFITFEERLPYIKNLNAETLLAGGFSKKTDAAAVTDDNLEGLNSFLEKAHSKDMNNMKVIVSLNVETVSITSTYFVDNLAECVGASPTGSNCQFLVWQENATATAEEGYQWVYDPTRGLNYKAPADDSSMAYVNYNSPDALKYSNDVVSQWFKRGVDGVQLGNFGMIQSDNLSATSVSIVNQNDTWPVIARSSMPGVAATNLATQNNTVVVNGQALISANKTGAGKAIQTAIEKWRAASTRIGAYTGSPLGSDLTAAQFDVGFATGLNLLLLCLPGVPIIRSGNEAGITNPVFNWSEDGMPVGADENSLNVMKAVSVLRVSGIQSLPSLQFDPRNADGKFAFLDTGNDDVVAIVRQWDVKPAVLIVSNMSPNDAVVNLAVENGLSADGDLLTSAKVLVSSVAKESLEKGKSVNLKELQINSGETLLLGA